MKVNFETNLTFSDTWTLPPTGLCAALSPVSWWPSAWRGSRDCPKSNSSTQTSCGQSLTRNVSRSRWRYRERQSQAPFSRYTRQCFFLGMKTEESQAIQCQGARQVKNHWSAWRANKWPLTGEILLSSVPSSNSLVSVLDPWRAFWADVAPFKGPRVTLCIASGTTEKHGHCQVGCTTRKGPMAASTTTGEKLDCAFVENALLFFVPKIGGTWAPLCPLHENWSKMDPNRSKFIFSANLYCWVRGQPPDVRRMPESGSQGSMVSYGKKVTLIYLFIF